MFFVSAPQVTQKSLQRGARDSDSGPLVPSILKVSGKKIPQGIWGSLTDAPPLAPPGIGLWSYCKMCAMPPVVCRLWRGLCEVQNPLGAELRTSLGGFCQLLPWCG